MARRHMLTYGTTPEQLAAVAATIRTNGHVNPEAVYYGRGPFSVDDILASRMIADPFHLLDCATTSEGGCGIVLVSAERTIDSPSPLWILGGASDSFGPAYAVAPVWDFRPQPDADTAGRVGARAARRAFSMAGLTPADVDVAELYDPFSFEVIRQLRNVRLLRGWGGWLVRRGWEHRARMAASPSPPTAAPCRSVTQDQRPAAAARRASRPAAARLVSHNQVEEAEVSLCSNGGAGALFCDVILLGRERP